MTIDEICGSIFLSRCMRAPVLDRLRAAKLKPDNSGDLNVGWSVVGFSSKDSRQKFSSYLSSEPLEHLAAISTLTTET